VFTRRTQLSVLTLAFAAVLSGCGAGPGSLYELANARCLVGTWTLVSVLDRPTMTPPWHKQGVVTVTFNADGTGHDEARGIDVSYLQDGRVVPQTLDSSNKFTWAVRGDKLSYPTDSPSITLPGRSATTAILVVNQRQPDVPDVFRCDGDTLAESHALRDIESATHQRTTIYRRS
jgi:hypothetical protein